MLQKASINLKLARIAANWTRSRLAAEIGRSPRFVQRVELGDGYARLTPGIKAKLAAVLSTPTEILFPDDPEGSAG